MPEQSLATPDLAHEIAEPRLQKLYAYWSSVRGARRLPARRDIDPLEFAYVLGHVMLVDVLRDPLRFRVRLHGSEMAIRTSRDLTGKLLDDLPGGDFRDYVVERCRGLVESAQPLRIEQDRALDGRQYRYEALWLPLSDDGATVSMLMLGLIYRPD
jgi:hypothetical protein